MVVLLILSGLLIFAVDQYLSDVDYVRQKRALVDLEEIVKTVRLYQIREGKPFPVATFSAICLGPLVGTYFEKEPPLDPWSRPYRHNPDAGVVYSVGPDGKDGFCATSDGAQDDIVVNYLPKAFYITKADWVDFNQNNLIDFGDYLEVEFSRPAQVKGITVFDFITSRPEKSLGSSQVTSSENAKSIQILFSPPILPTFVVGQTTIRPRPFLESVKDFSPTPQLLDPNIEVVINRRRM